jgi:hypothetical protein
MISASGCRRLFSFFWGIVEPRVESFKLFLQKDWGQMGIDLSRQYRYVSKKLLNGTEVCAILQQMRRKTMSQHVGMDMSQACTTRGSINDAPDVAQRERSLRFRIAKS